MPAPDHMLEVGSGSHAAQTARTMERLEPVLVDEQPDLVMVPGDVNSTLAAALTAVKMGIPVAHIESGLRSFDLTMPEEVNRIVADRFSELALPPQRRGDGEPARRRHPRRAHAHGRQHDDRHPGRAGRSLPGGGRRPPGSGSSPAPTRSSPCTAPPWSTAPLLAETVAQLAALAQRDAGRLPGPPAHPQDDGGRPTPTHPGLHLIEPLGYLDFLSLLADARRRPHRLRRDPGGDDLPRHPLLHPARQHRAAGDDPRRHQHPARARPGGDRRHPGGAGCARRGAPRSRRRSGTATPRSGSPT